MRRKPEIETRPVINPKKADKISKLEMLFSILLGSMLFLMGFSTFIKNNF